MSKKYYLGIDQGTTGTTALIFDEDWNICSKGYTEHTQYYPQPGWVEHDPIEIWNKTKELGFADDIRYFYLISEIQATLHNLLRIPELHLLTI